MVYNPFLMKRIVISFVFVILGSASFSQTRFHHCGAEEIRQEMMATSPAFKAEQEKIEMFTQSYVSLIANSKKTRATIYRIPVVVHVIHNGEPIGNGANISVAQVNSQIAVLNKDYRLKNTDSLVTTHAFYGATDDCEIEFCLATLDPLGNLTTGIDRTDAGQATYDYPELETNIKPNTIWDNTRYLNIWVCKLGGTASTLLGYATPPGTATDNDGIVIRTNSFGTVGNVTSPFNKGRTATHETGHYFNLRHIWGDAPCGNDLVGDTPVAEEENYGCPSFFPYNENNTCGGGANGEMYMNYMDYVNDNCMKMFTTGQKNRMRATLVTGGSRSSLTVSNGCTWPVGLTEVSKTSDLTFFPNPASDHFYIKNTTDFSKDVVVKIVNTIGQDLSSLVGLQKETSNRLYVNTASLPNGTYFITINSNSQSTGKSFTILK